MKVKIYNGRYGAYMSVDDQKKVEEMIDQYIEEKKGEQNIEKEEIKHTDIYLCLSDHNVKIYIENCEGTKQVEIRKNEIIYKHNNIFDEIVKIINSYENTTVYYDKWYGYFILENIKSQCPEAEFKGLSYKELQNYI